MPSILPVDWKDVLKRFQGWLQEADRLADEREEAFRRRLDDANPELPAPPGDGLEERLRELPNVLRPFQEATAVAEQAAAEHEERLRGLVERSESLRLRLAARTGRAIG